MIGPGARITVILPEINAVPGPSPYLERLVADGRLGMESGKGFRRSNAEQVTKIRRIVEELGLEVATLEDARRMLALKGADRVGF